MSNVPEGLRYTKDHEWAKLEGKRARIGITDFAQDQLTDVVYVELPPIGAKISLTAFTDSTVPIGSPCLTVFPIGGSSTYTTSVN